MLFNLDDLKNEINNLQVLILNERMAFGEGIKMDMEFTDLKKIFLQIKKMESRLELCYQESNAQKEYNLQ
jgi:hypothetical protein